MWQPWSSEIVADVFALVHTGYASVAALYDVVGDSATILRWPVGDPHPVGWIRTLLGCAMCRLAYGDGDLDRPGAVHSAGASAADGRTQDVGAAETVTGPAGSDRSCVPNDQDPWLRHPADWLARRPAAKLPSTLAGFERDAGASLWTSPHWRHTEGIRMVALSGLREAEQPERAAEWIDRARMWLTGLAVAA